MIVHGRRSHLLSDREFYCIFYKFLEHVQNFGAPNCKSDWRPWQKSSSVSADKIGSFFNRLKRRNYKVFKFLKKIFSFFFVLKMFFRLKTFLSPVNSNFKKLKSFSTMHSLISLYTLRVKNSFGSVKPLYCVPEEIN